MYSARGDVRNGPQLRLCYVSVCASFMTDGEKNRGHVWQLIPELHTHTHTTPTLVWDGSVPVTLLHPGLLSTALIFITSISSYSLSPPHPSSPLPSSFCGSCSQLPVSFSPSLLFLFSISIPAFHIILFLFKASGLLKIFKYMLHWFVTKVD